MKKIVSRILLGLAWILVGMILGSFIYGQEIDIVGIQNIDRLVELNIFLFQPEVLMVHLLIVFAAPLPALVWTWIYLFSGGEDFYNSLGISLVVISMVFIVVGAYHKVRTIVFGGIVWLCLSCLVIFQIQLFLFSPNSAKGRSSAKSTLSTDKERIRGSAGSILEIRAFNQFNEPWAMTFLPSGEMLVTEKPGNLLLISADGRSKLPVAGVPEVAYGGQGGLGDVIIHPQYESNQQVYISYAEQDSSGKKGAAVALATLKFDPNKPILEDVKVIWRQKPKVTGSGHYSHRLVFDSEGYLFITSGERQKQKPAQDWAQNLGKIIRLNADGSVPIDNPFQDKGEIAKTFWSLGHRNLLGIAFDKQGRLWTHEMGPKHGDEFNLIVAGDNYGWPIVSWGDQYSGVEIPDHDTRPEFNAPELYWIPTVAPSGLIIYDGDHFPEWQGNAFIGGLASRSLVRIKLDGNSAEEVERFLMEKRIREVEQGPDGAIWVLEDKQGGRLLKLTKSGEDLLWKS